MAQLSYNAAKAVLPTQINALSPNQLQALRQVTEVNIPSPKGASGADDARPEETRSLGGDSETDHTGRAKGGRMDTSDAMEEAGISDGTTSTTSSTTTSSTTPPTTTQTKAKGAANRLNHSLLLLLPIIIFAMFLV